MLRMFSYSLYFDVEENTNTSADFAPAVSIDHVNRLREGFRTLAEILGISTMVPAPVGTVVKRYKKTVTTPAGQVAEGEVVPLSKVSRTPLTDLVMQIRKYRRLTTAEAIQSVGADIAINAADEDLAGQVRRDVKGQFFSMLAAAGSTAVTGAATLQATIAALWAGLQTAFEDIDCRPVYFLNPSDVATYLGTAQISTQDAFGFSYLSDFLGMGTAIISPAVPEKTVYATAAENLAGAYVPQGGDLGDAFGLTFDESGMVGLTHTISADRASIQSLLLSGVVFYPEDQSKILKSEIA